MLWVRVDLVQSSIRRVKASLLAGRDGVPVFCVFVCICSLIWILDSSDIRRERFEVLRKQAVLSKHGFSPLSPAHQHIKQLVRDLLSEHVGMWNVYRWMWVQGQGPVFQLTVQIISDCALLFFFYGLSTKIHSVSPSNHERDYLISSSKKLFFHFCFVCKKVPFKTLLLYHRLFWETPFYGNVSLVVCFHQAGCRLRFQLLLNVYTQKRFFQLT